MPLLATSMKDRDGVYSITLLWMHMLNCRMVAQKFGSVNRHMLFLSLDVMSAVRTSSGIILVACASSIPRKSSTAGFPC